MKKSGFIFFFPLLLLVCSCSEFTENQQNLVDKKWYFGKGSYLEYKSNFKEYILFEGKTSEFEYEFTSDNGIRTFTNNDSIKTYDVTFEIKDSFLLLLFENPESLKTDTFLYHLNPNYEYWQIREVYKYGKIINKKDPNPFIPFEF